MGSPYLFTLQQALKVGYFTGLRVKNSNHLNTELSLGYVKDTKVYRESKAFFIHISSIASFKPFLIVWWEYCTFSDSSVVSFKSSTWPKYTQYGTIFPKKSSSTIKLFFFFKCVILFLANTWKKSGVIGLASSQTAVKCGHGFRVHSQDGELARWALGRDTKGRSCYAQKRLRNAKPGNHLKGTCDSMIVPPTDVTSPRLVSTRCSTSKDG